MYDLEIKDTEGFWSQTVDFYGLSRKQCLDIIEISKNQEHLEILITDNDAKPKKVYDVNEFINLN